MIQNLVGGCKSLKSKTADHDVEIVETFVETRRSTLGCFVGEHQRQSLSRQTCACYPRKRGVAMFHLWIDVSTIKILNVGKHHFDGFRSSDFCKLISASPPKL